MAFTISRQSLILDLYSAFYTARRHKTSKHYVKTFERHLKRNIESLADELYNRTYKPEPSSCFVIERPKKREVFAAQFRDRVVHHLYYNYTHELFERTFIQDSYSCIPNRGTHYGVKRLVEHTRKESENYTKTCYALQIDIRGYFMHINRSLLKKMTIDTIDKMRTHVAYKGKTWEEIIDIDFVKWLTEEIVMLNPKTSCKIVGSLGDWNGLDRNKSLFFTEEGCGLPIGNLTSQLFSNVYLNAFDQYIKRVLKCKHYGRYVDDAYIIGADKRWLMSVANNIGTFLSNNLGLSLHKGKLHVIDVRYGVGFLGAFVKPFRTYVSNSTLRRMLLSISKLNMNDKESVYRSVNSYLGSLRHYKSYRIRSAMFLRPKFLCVAPFNREVTKMLKTYKYP